MKKIWKTLGVLLMVLLILFPVAVLYITTARERKEYSQPVPPKWKQKAYGEVYPAEYGTVKEVFSVNGTYQSDGWKVQRDKKDVKDHLTVLPSSGREVFQGELIGYVGDKAIYSSVNAILERAEDQGTEYYFSFRTFDHPVLEAEIPYRAPVEIGSKVTDEDGNTYEVIALSGKSVREKRLARFKTDGKHLVGDKFIGDFYTGKEITDVLRVPLSCIYRKTKDGDFFVRTVSEDRTLGREIQIRVGADDGHYAVVEGVKEGTLMDSGFADMNYPYKGEER